MNQTFVFTPASSAARLLVRSSRPRPQSDSRRRRPLREERPPRLPVPVAAAGRRSPRSPRPPPWRRPPVPVAPAPPCPTRSVSVSSPRDLPLALTLPQSPSRPDPPAKERPPKSAGDGRVQMPKGNSFTLRRSADPGPVPHGFSRCVCIGQPAAHGPIWDLGCKVSGSAAA